MRELTSTVIGAAIEVHRTLGPGLLESAYETCLAHELHLRAIPFSRQLPMPIAYKGQHLDCGYRIDLLIANQLCLELKAVDALHPIHEAQLLTYMRLANLKLGLLINFGAPLLKNGLKRLIL